MQVKIRKDNLIITLPVEEPRLSASGKTRVIASTRGVRKTTIRVDGKIVSVVANAFIPADEHVEPNTAKKKHRPGAKRKNSKRRRKAVRR